MRKMNQDIRDVVYVHLNESDRYVLSYGIEFPEFFYAFSESLNRLLLLKHQFDDGEFNMHTMLEYVPKKRLLKLANDDVYSYGDFCWIDFEEMDGLNELSGQTIAELLYLGHLKDHLKAPFYDHLSNRFVYLAHDDGWYNKTYYRYLDDFYFFLGDVIAQKSSRLKLEKTLLGLRKKKAYPSIPKEDIFLLKAMMKEGMVVSLKKSSQTRTRIEIPIWVIGDFADMDIMYEEYEKMESEKRDANLIFDKKTKEWSVELL